MGTQQLLLIVLSVIIVGISVAIGITMFSEGSAKANLDALTIDMQRYASACQQWAKKPLSMGGGANSFATIGTGAAAFTNIGMRNQNDNGTFTITGPTATQLTLTGVGTSDGDDDGINCTIVMTVLDDSVRTNVTNR